MNKSYGPNIIITQCLYKVGFAYMSLSIINKILGEPGPECTLQIKLAKNRLNSPIESIFKR